MTDKQPEALRLADALTTPSSFQFSRWDVAAELRRLHEVNAELVEALVDAGNFVQAFNSHQDLLEKIDAALAKAQGDNNGD